MRPHDNIRFAKDIEEGEVELLPITPQFLINLFVGSGVQGLTRLTERSLGLSEVLNRGITTDVYTTFQTHDGMINHSPEMVFSTQVGLRRRFQRPQQPSDEDAISYGYLLVPLITIHTVPPGFCPEPPSQTLEQNFNNRREEYRLYPGIRFERQCSPIEVYRSSLGYFFFRYHGAYEAIIGPYLDQYSERKIAEPEEVEKRLNKEGYFKALYVDTSRRGITRREIRSVAEKLAFTCPVKRLVIPDEPRKLRIA